MKSILVKHYPHLRSLRLYDNHVDILRSYIYLEKLIVIQLPAILDVKDFPSGFTVYPSEVQPVISLISSLPNLQAINCSHYVPSHSPFEAIRGTRCRSEDLLCRECECDVDPQNRVFMVVLYSRKIWS